MLAARLRVPLIAVGALVLLVDDLLGKTDWVALAGAVAMVWAWCCMPGSARCLRRRSTSGRRCEVDEAGAPITMPASKEAMVAP